MVLQHLGFADIGFMGRIDSWTVRRVTDAARIEEVVGDFIPLKKSGVRFLGLCPFHEDRHLGSFVVFPKGNCYKCFTCDSKGGPVRFLMAHAGLSFPDAVRWLGRKYGVAVDGEDVSLSPPPSRPALPPLPMLELPMRMVEARERLEDDLLVRWMKSGIRWDGLQRSRIDTVLKEYHVGHSRHGHTIFWQIDERGRVRTGKMMKYGADGHRDKASSWNFDWIHSSLFRDRRLAEYDEEKVDVKPTLFGMHLLDKYSQGDVCIVESEKTAVLMAIAYGNNGGRVWMACGGKENISVAKLNAVMERGRKIVLYPDRDGIGEWRRKAEMLRYVRLAVDVRPVTEWWTEQDGEKADIADVVVRSLNNGWNNDFNNCKK